MLQKIKDGIKWVGLPLLALLGYIFYLVTRNKNLESELARKEIEGKMSKSLDDLAEAKENADEKEQEFNDRNAAYRRSMAEYLASKGKLPE